jgi:hypothetical protein
VSLQDDYFDLKASLKGENKKRFLRIWEAFCEAEAENDELLEISRGVRMMIDGVFKRQRRLEEACREDH